MNRKVDVPAVILNNVKYPHNLAASIRACSCFGVDTLMWTGKRFEFSERERLPREERMKGYAHVNVIDTERPFDKLPEHTIPVCIELLPSSMSLTLYAHPENAAYIFGPEDGHVDQVFRRFCHHFIFIPSYHCLNLSAAINVVLADRMMKRQVLGLEPHHVAGENMREHRGELPIQGWDVR
jgi:tRNA(Leu) C34 or U34 (ribose-2'-O)-methylase TrmL